MFDVNYLDFRDARPESSRVYLAEATATVTADGETSDTQDFSFTLTNARQVAVRVEPTRGSSLRANVQLLNESEVSLAVATHNPSAGDRDAIIQPLTLPAGTYVIRVTGAGGSAGRFGLEAQLGGAGFEEEAAGGAPGTAPVDMDNAPILLQGGGRLKAITGRADGNGRGDLFKLELAAGQSLSALLGSETGGNGQFGSETEVRTDGGYTGVRVADMNGDGRQDLILGGNRDSGGGVLSVLLATDDGNYERQTWLDAGNQSITDFEIADFDGDGDLDVAAAAPGWYYEFSPESYDFGEVRILRNDGSGQLESYDWWSTGPGVHALAIGDVDGDGDQDLVLGSYPSSDTPDGSIYTMLNDGSSDFGAGTRQFYADGRVYDVQTGDFDGDGRDDIVVATGNEDGSEGGIRLYRMDYSVPGIPGSFGFSYGFQQRIVNIAVADLNGDGNLDVVGIEGAGFGSGHANTLFGDGEGDTYSSTGQDLSDRGFDERSEILLADVNRDGRPDAIVSRGGDGNSDDGVRVTINSSDGYFFGGSYDVSTGSSARGFATADFNGDGDPELVQVRDELIYDENEEAYYGDLSIHRGQGEVRMQLLDAAQNVIALPANGGYTAHQSILDFIAQTAGTYYIRVDGDYEERYTLATTVNAQLGLEAFDGRTQDLTKLEQVAGRISHSEDVDDYPITLKVGDTINASAIARGNGSDDDALQVLIELRGPNGALVAGTGTAGLTASYTYTATAAGTYTVRVVAASGRGDYDVRVTGATGAPPPLTIRSKSPETGAFVDFEPGVSLLFSLPILQTSLQATDLVVSAVDRAGNVLFTNRSPANTFQYTADGIYFYDSELFGRDATFTVTIADGALTSTSGQPLVGQTWSFTVDAQGPKVVSSSIAEGQTLSPNAPITWEASFNEKLLQGISLGMFYQLILGPEDIRIKNLSTLVEQGATNMSQDDYNTGLDYNFVLGSLTEGSYRGWFRSEWDGFQDEYRHLLDGETTGNVLPSGDGFAGGDFVRNFIVDATGPTVLNTLPARGPKGGQVYEASDATRAFHGTGDVDSFTISLDSNQRITVLLEPTAGGAQAAARLQLFGPDGTTVLASADGDAGEPVVLNDIAGGAAGGTYRIDATSLEGLSGYTLRVIVNAQAERELAGGPDNGSIATAETIALRSITGGAGQRGAVVGRIPKVDTVSSALVDPDVDYYRIDLSAGQAASFAISSATANAATFSIVNAAGDVMVTGAAGSPNYDRGVIDFVAPAAGSYYVVVTGDGADYTLVATRNATIERDSTEANAPVQDLTRTGEALGHLARGGTAASAIRVAHVGADNAGTASGNYDPDRLIKQLNDDSTRNFTATRVTSADVDTLAELNNYDVIILGTLADFGQAGFANALVAWVQGGGSLVVAGYANNYIGNPIRSILPVDYGVTSGGSTNTITTTGVSHPITAGVGSFTVDAGFYYGPVVSGATVLATTASGAPAAVVRNVGTLGGRTVFLASEYDDSYNGNTSLRGALTGADRLFEQAVAWAGTSGDRQDDYRLALNAGDTVTITTSSPNTETALPVNTIDPILDLVAPDGSVVASNDNGLDGRNARIIYTVPAGATGVYRVVVRSTDPAGGNYTVKATGYTSAAPTTPGTSILVTSPTEGQSFATAPTAIEFTLSGNVLASSVQVSDLTLTGGTVTGVTLVDGRTVRFTVSGSNLEGVYTYSLAANAFTDAQGNGTEAYTGTYNVDTTGPRVVSVTPTETSAPFTGWTITFTEAIDPSSFTAADLVSFTGPAGAGGLSYRELRISGNTVVFEIYPETAAGTYTLVFGPNITDLVGNRMDQDGDGIKGESVQDRYTATTVVSSPNLVVDNVTVVGTPVFGSPITVRYTVRNAGSDPTTVGTWNDRLELSTGTAFGGGTTLSTLPAITTPLAPGASYTREVTITLPLNTSLDAGTYYFNVRADQNSRQFESNENDNDGSSAATTVALPALPDLAVSNVELVSPATPYSGAPATIRWTLTNLGTETVTQVIREDIYLSADATFGGDPLIGGVDYTVNLAPGESVVRTATVNLPIAQAGERRFFVRTDANNVVFEHTKEANNTASSAPVTITLPPLVDLVVTGITTPTTATGGTNVNVAWTLANAGTSDWSGTITEVIALSPDASIGGDTVYKTVSFTGSIPAGGSIERVESIALPVSLTGNFYAVITTDANNNVFEGVGESNNVAIDDVAMAVSLPETPDLIVTSITAPATTLGGRNVPISWTLRNDGTAAVNGTFSERVYLSADGTIGGDDILFGTFTFTGSLAPGQTVTRNQSISLPRVFSGSFRVVVVTDANNNVFENVGESNNAAIDDVPIAVTQAPYPNLLVENVVAPTTASSNEEIELSWTTSNRGDASTNAAAWSERVYLSTDGTLNSTDVLVASFNNASYLNAGESFRRTERITLPVGLQGDYRLIVVTDANDSVFEYVPTGNAEADNDAASGVVAVSLTPPPDLRVTNVVGPVIAFSGASANVSWSVSNLGGGATRSTETRWTDVVYLSKDNVFDASDKMLGDVEHNGGLAAGQGYTQSAQFRLPTGISGDYYFIVRTDVTQRVYEGAFESNNSGAESSPTDVRLTPPSDLVTTIVGAPVTATAGRRISVAYRVANEGATATPSEVSQWTDRLYFSTTATFDPATAINIASRTRNGALAAGGSYDAAFDVSVPLNLNGTYYAFVISDVEDKVFEVDNANNRSPASSSIAISQQFADLQIETFAPPANASANSAVPFTWTVRNAGTGDSITNQWFDRVTLSADNVLGNGDDVTLGSILHNGLLAPGASYTVTTPLTIPAYVATGTYNVFFRTDANGNVVETNDANNSNGFTPATITIGQSLADLRVTAIDAPIAAQDGSSYTVRYTVSNLGSATTNASNWTDELWLSADSTIGDGDVLLRQTQRTNVLGANGTYEVQATVTIPNGVTGTYRIIARADANDRVIEGAFEGNNDTAAPATTIALRPTPDLDVTSVVAPAEAYAGQRTTLTYTVTNVGVGAINTRWYDSVYLSLDRVYDNSDVALTSLELTDFMNPGGLMQLPAGGSYTRTVSFTLPAGASGPYTLIVRADASDKIYERPNNELNNIGIADAATDVMLLPPADLVAGQVLVPVNGTPGRPASITYTVANNSSRDALGRWDDSLFLSADATWDINDKLFARNEHVGTVRAGESYTHTVTAALPGVTPGEYYLIVRSDIGNQVPESNEENNLSASIEQVLLDVPTLTLGAPDAGTIAQGQAVYYRVTVGEGETLLVDFDAAATTGSTQLFVKYGEVPTRADFDFGYDGALDADQQIIVPKTQAGTYYILAYGDALPSPVSYEIVARTLEFEVVNDDFGAGGNAGDLTIQVDGAKFDRAVAATLVDSVGNERAAKRIWYNSSTRLYVTFDLRGLAVGDYDVKFTKPGAAASIVEDGLSVVAPRSGNGAKPSLFAPNGTTAGALFQYTVNWGNDSLNDIAVPLIVTGSSDRTVSFYPDGSQSPAFTFVGVSQDDGPAGILRPGQSAQRQLYARNGPQGTGISIYADRLGEVRGKVFDWQHQRTTLVGVDDLTDEQFERMFARLVENIGPTWGNYLDALGESASLIPIRLGNNRVAESVLRLDVLRATAETSTSITGRAFIPDLDVAIANRSVIATNRATGESFATVSWNDGTFVLANLTPGTYDLDFEGAAVVGGGTFTVADGQHATGHLLTLGRGSTIGGIVRDATNKPIEGAVVRAYSSAGITVDGLTAADGSYRFTGISPGSWTVFVDARGFARGVVENVELAVDGTEAHNFALAPQSRLIGTVNSAVGPDKPLGVTARRLSADGTPLSGAAFLFDATLVGGDFDVTGLPAGTYEIAAFRDGYVPAFTTVTIGAGATLNVGTLVLARAATISGSVSSTDAASSPSYINIGVFRTDGSLVTTGMARLNGTFTIEGVPAGEYTVRPVVPGAFGDPTPVSLVTGQQLTGLGLVIRPGGTVSGTLRTSIGSPVAGATVTLISPDGSRRRALTDASGNYAFTRLDRGQYSLVAGNTTTAASVTTLDATPPLSVPLTLSVAGVVSGTLRGVGGTPVGGVVRVVRDGEVVGTGTANAQGRYQLLLAIAGTYDLYAESSAGSFAPLLGLIVSNGASLVRDFNSGTSVARVSVGGLGAEGATLQLFRVDPSGVAEAGVAKSSGGAVQFRNLRPGSYRLAAIGAGAAASGAMIDFTVGNGTTDVAITLVAQGAVRGAITGPGGTPIGNARLYLVDSEGVLLGVSDADGEYSIENVPAGTYDLYVVAAGHAVVVRSGVTIGAGGETVVIDQTLSTSGASITGRLLDAAGQAWHAGGYATIAAAGGRVPLGTAQLAADGSYAFAGVSGTSLTITVVGTGAPPITISNIAVGAGASASVADVKATLVVYATGALPTSAAVTTPGASASPSGSRGTRAATAADNSQSDQGLPVPRPSQPKSLFDDVPFLLPTPPFVDQLLDLLNSLQRRPEVQPGDVPGLDECKTCAAAQAAVFNNIRLTDMNWDVVDSYAKDIKRTVREIGTAFVLEATQVAGIFASLILAVEAAGTLLATAAFGAEAVGAAGFAGLGVIPEGGFLALSYGVAQISGAAVGLYTLFRDIIKGATVESVSEGLVAVLNSQLSLNTIFTNVIGIAGQIGRAVSANSAAYAKYAGPLGDILGFLINGQNLLDRLSLKLFRESINQLKGIEEQYNFAVDRYQKQAKKTFQSLTQYKNCLRNAPEECGPEDPDEPDEPHDPPVFIPVFAARDPNDISGPKGYGPQNFVSSRAPMGYTIRFENAADATAPARHVSITQTLDSDLDARTFRLGDFGIGDMIFNVPADSAFYQTRLDMRETLGIYVDVVAGIDVASGVAFWEIFAIDPATGDIPTNPLLGFLPPNLIGPEGEGFVRYSVRARSTATTGVVIDAIASIVFDENAPIETPPIFHTLDAIAATSAVKPIGGVSEGQTDFAVEWAGVDDVGGSAIAAYDVYVAVDGRPFVLWLNSTELTTATYRGEAGHTYAFYSVARDNAGNEENAPTTPDASVRLPGVNLAPTVEIDETTIEIKEGVAFGVTGTAFDPDVDDTFTLEVDYGDGAGFRTVVVDADGNFSLGAMYGDDGLFDVVVRGTDLAGARTLKTFKVNVTNAAPTIDAIANRTLNWDGSGATLTLVAHAADVPADVLTAEVDYDGDGVFAAVPVGADGMINLSNRYTAAGTYAVTLRVSDDDGGISTRTFTVTVLPAPPIATGLTVNTAGSVQRSMVTSLTIGFDRAVDLTSSGFVLYRRNASGGRDAVTDVTYTLTRVDSAGLSWRITFSGAAAVGGSLADGVYDFVLGGNNAVGAASYTFHRLFGDVDGNKNVDGVDENAFRAAYRTTRGSAGYVDGLDYDGNGVIDRNDETAFRSRYRKMFNY